MSIFITGGSSLNLSQNSIDAINGAEGESTANPFATISDVAGGGAGAALLLTGGTMTGDIIFGTAGQYIGEGNFDTSRGGVNGLSLVCSVGYELNWQAGWLTTTEQNSTTPRPLYLDSVAGTTLRAWDYAGNTGTTVSHTGITFPDNTTQTTAGGGGGTTITGPYDMTKPWIVAWNPNTSSFATLDNINNGQLFLDQGAAYGADFGSYAGLGGVPAIRVTADGWTTWTELRGDGIRFPDGTTQTTAGGGGGGGGSPTVVNLVGTGVTYTAAVGDRIFLVDGGINVDLTFLYTEPVGIEITVVNQDATSPATIASAFSGVRGSNQIAIQSAAKFVTGADGYWHRIV